MTDLFAVPDRDLCQPPWLADFVDTIFADYFHHYSDEYDYTDYIYPIEPDGVTTYLFKSHVGEILKMHTSQEVHMVVEYLRSIDLIQREYLPSEHFDGLHSIVSKLSLSISFF